MILHTGPTCPACGTTRRLRALFCDGCWAEMPTKARRGVDTAWKAYSAHPGSLHARHDYEQAIAAAVEAIR